MEQVGRQKRRGGVERRDDGKNFGSPPLFFKKWGVMVISQNLKWGGGYGQMFGEV